MIEEARTGAGTGMTPVWVVTSSVDLVAENADLRQRLASIETVALELIAERDRAVAELERLQQLSLLGEPA